MSSDQELRKIRNETENQNRRLKRIEQYVETLADIHANTDTIEDTLKRTNELLERIIEIQESRE